jgi:hypothetical protein
LIRNGAAWLFGSARQQSIHRLHYLAIVKDCGELAQRGIRIATGNPGQTFDIGPAGPEWRFISSRAPETEWCGAAYDFAGEHAP